MAKPKTTTKRGRRGPQTKRLHDEYYDLKNPAGYGGAKGIFPKKWLATQPTYTLHKPVKRRFPTRKYRTSGIDHVWQMDLMEMIPYASINKGNRYILTCIDLFSRFARAIATKSKEGKEVASAVLTLFADKSPTHVQTDRGKEFYNKHVQEVFTKHKVKHYTVNSQFKAALVERFNRTLREKLNRYFTHTGKKTWIHVLDDIVDTYNKTPHGGIEKQRPIDITLKTEAQLWTNQQQKQVHVRKSPHKLLEHVRISRIADGPFRKNFDQNWSEEVFRIIGTDTTANPIMYVVEDIENVVIEGRFYHEELQVVAKPEVYRIEKIIKTRGTGKYKQWYVKWYGYDSKHNSWISEKPNLGV